MTILIIVAVILFVLFLGGLIAWLFTKADTIVTGTKMEMVAEQQAYNPAVTMGHEIKVTADYPTQMKEARLEAAKTAASLPRGGNLRIGSLGDVRTVPASEALTEDPLTAVRIAQFHGWDGARSGVPIGGVPTAAATAAVATAAAPAATGEIEVVAGRDYQEIAITDDMAPEDVRKARVANAKARSAALKAAKAAQSGAAPTAAAPVAAAGAVAATTAPMAVGIEAPKLIEITDDMAPEDVRKARVANAKAQSAYNKALKAAGATAGATPAPAPAAAAPAAAVAAPSAAIGIEPPQLIEITDSMSPEDIRKARVANAKAQSAYSKALKAAGIDPSAASAGAAEAPQTAAPVVEQAAEAPTAPVQATASGPTPESMGIAKPQLVEITDAMAPEEIRRARVENAKAMSAYNKALKTAGIDPASVK